MEKEAVSAGFYHSPSWKRDYAKIQILTVQDLLSGKKVDLPSSKGTFKQAPKMRPEGGKQGELGL